MERASIRPLFCKAALPAGSCLPAKSGPLCIGLKTRRHAFRALASSSQQQEELSANPHIPPHAFKMKETQRMTVDPGALPWAGWPNWRPSGRPQSNPPSTDPAASSTHLMMPSVQAKD
eukprot:scaffold82954_cov15-Tisochrysis_lutea.AAC.2